MLLNGSQIFVEVLCEQGVDTIFGYPGGSVLNLYDELYKNSDRITHVLTAHEQGAAHAADGYARATGRTGVVLATSGPGATNLVTGIATRLYGQCADGGFPPATLPPTFWAGTASRKPISRASPCPSPSTTSPSAA